MQWGQVLETRRSLPYFYAAYEEGYRPQETPERRAAR